MVFFSVSGLSCPWPLIFEAKIWLPYWSVQIMKTSDYFDNG